jgi:hypothetical protein
MNVIILSIVFLLIVGLIYRWYTRPPEMPTVSDNAIKEIHVHEYEERD